MTYRDLAFGAFRQEVAGIDTVRAENDILRNSLAETTAQVFLPFRTDRIWRCYRPFLSAKLT